MLLHCSRAQGGQPAAQPRPVGNLGVPYLSPILVHRHGGRILQPAEAVLAPGSRPPAATAYRANTLLIPDSAMRDREIVEALDEALERVGLTLETPPPLIESLPSLRPWVRELADLPRAVVLRVREGAPPTSVDAWVALQALRGSAGRPENLLAAEVSTRITLDHLLSSATTAVSGDPA